MPTWIKTSDKNPSKRLNCFVYVHTPLQGGYDYKTTRVWDGEKWEGIQMGEYVVSWLDESAQSLPSSPSGSGEGQELYRWVKASERLPEKAGTENKVVIRSTGFGKDKFGHECRYPFVSEGCKNFDEDDPKFYFELGSKSYLTNENIEWLEKVSTPSPSSPSIGIGQVGDEMPEEIKLWAESQTRGLSYHSKELVLSGMKVLWGKIGQQLTSCQAARDEAMNDANVYKELYAKAQKDIASLTEQLGKVMEERDAFRKACGNFVDKVTMGEARSVSTFKEMNDLLNKFPPNP